jgi:hypothetical protein
MKKVIIDIDPNGNCSIDGQGFQGTECSHFIQEIEKSLGDRISIKDKPEYNQRQQTRGRNTQKESR